MSTSGIFREFHAALVPVRDVEKSAEWYESKLGLEARRKVPGMAVMGAGGTAHICLFQSPDQAKTDSGVFVSFRVDDLDATRKLLEDRGVACSEVHQMPQLRYLTIQDNDANRIDVCEYGPDWLA